MTHNKALQELGIERSASPDEARRAYLHGVKTHKPDTDPEGFRRLRESYEVVAGLLKEQPAVEGEEDWEEEEDAAPELANLAARLSRLPSEFHGEERLAVLRQAVQDYPASPGVRWWLVQELRQTGLEKELLAVLRAAEAAGFPGFLETRIARFPDSVDANELARLESSGDLDTLSVTAKVYLQRSRPREAVAALNRVIDRLLEHEDPATRPLPSWLPGMMLAVEAVGLPQDARALHDRLWQWLSGTGDANLLKSWGAVHWWKVAHELGQLDPAFPAELRQAAAQAALTGDVDPAEEKAKRFAKTKAKKAEKVSEMLHGLPTLYDLYYNLLQRTHTVAYPEDADKDRRTKLAGLGTLVWLLIVFAAVVFARCPGISDRPASSNSSSGFSRSTNSSSEIKGPKAERLKKGATEAWSTLGGACEGFGSAVPLRRSSCDLLQRTVLAMQNGDCRGAHVALEDLEVNIQGASDREVTLASDFEKKALNAITSSCGSSTLSP